MFAKLRKAIRDWRIRRIQSQLRSVIRELDQLGHDAMWAFHCSGMVDVRTWGWTDRALDFGGRIGVLKARRLQLDEKLERLK